MSTPRIRGQGHNCFYRAIAAAQANIAVMRTFVEFRRLDGFKPSTRRRIGFIS